jgi:acetyltransferase-like isoleucine patch superfamily enzyme
LQFGKFNIIKIINYSKYKLQMKKIIKLYQYLRIIKFKALSTNRIKGIKPIIIQPLLLAGKGEIFFSENVTLGYNPSPYLYSGNIYIEARKKSARIRFGKNFFSNNNLTIIAEDGEISIGEDILIGTNVEIINSDFHQVHPHKRNNGEHHSKDIFIGNNVFIGSNVKILKGVRIGINSIISNGAVVYDNVADNTIVRGNPAVFYKNIIL